MIKDVIDGNLFRVRSLVRSSFFVACSFFIPKTLRSRIKLSRTRCECLSFVRSLFPRHYDHELNCHEHTLQFL